MPFLCDKSNDKTKSVAHACYSSTWETKAEGHCEFEVTLGYIVSSRPAWITYGDAGSKEGERYEVLT